MHICSVRVNEDDDDNDDDDDDNNNNNSLSGIWLQMQTVKGIISAAL
jgi:hypothetical protein